MMGMGLGNQASCAKTRLQYREFLRSRVNATEEATPNVGISSQHAPQNADAALLWFALYPKSVDSGCELGMPSSTPPKPDCAVRSLSRFTIPGAMTSGNRTWHTAPLPRYVGSQLTAIYRAFKGSDLMKSTETC